MFSYDQRQSERHRVLQKRGFKFVKVYPGSMEYVRKIKPAVPLIGENGIPLRDKLGIGNDFIMMTKEERA